MSPESGRPALMMRMRRTRRAQRKSEVLRRAISKHDLSALVIKKGDLRIRVSVNVERPQNRRMMYGGE